jgi:hypothetical protein
MHRPSQVLSLSALLIMTACSPVPAEEEPPEDQSSGLITTISLNFTPNDGGEPLSFLWSDPEGDGDPIVDEIPLPDASNHNHHDARNYTLDIEVWNDLEDPPRDIAADIEEAGEEFQFFFTGSAVEGPATENNSEAILAHQYADSDSSGFPLGLRNDISTLSWGSGQLTVTLRHIPPTDDQVLKTEELASEIAQGGFDSVDGESDLQVTFEVEVE